MGEIWKKIVWERYACLAYFWIILIAENNNNCFPWSGNTYTCLVLWILKCFTFSILYLARIFSSFLALFFPAKIAWLNIRLGEKYWHGWWRDEPLVFTWEKMSWSGEWMDMLPRLWTYYNFPLPEYFYRAHVAFSISHFPQTFLMRHGVNCKRIFIVVFTPLYCCQVQINQT